MGPRARARGNAALGGGLGGAAALQWGHERALVEMPDVFGQCLLTHELQWGHERALVEISKPSSSHFTLSLLQWGHERALVEIC